MGKKFLQNKNSPLVQQHFQVFVSGLPYETTEDDIKIFFNFAGQPKIKLPKYQDTGRCLGYGHIQFSSFDEYKKALQKDSQHIGNRYINVKPAKGNKKIESEAKNVPVGCKILFVKNLPYSITEQQIKAEFSSCGVILQVRMIRNWQTKIFKGFAYVEFRDNGSVKKAIAKYNLKQFRGRTLTCDSVTTKMKKGFKRQFIPQDTDAHAQQIEFQVEQQQHYQNNESSVEQQQNNQKNESSVEQQQNNQNDS